MIKDYKNISRKEFLFRFFDLWNVLQPEAYRLTYKEMWLLIEFMLLPEPYKYSRFGTRARKTIIKTLEAQGWKLLQQGLVQFIKSLEIKGLIVRDEEDIRQLHKNILPLIDKKRTDFTLTFNFNIDNAK